MKHDTRSTKEMRQRQVEVLMLQAGIPLPRRVSREQRQRIVDVICLKAGLPMRDWSRGPRGRPEPIDMTEFDAIREEMQARARERQLLLAHLRLVEDRDLSVRCLTCGDTVAFNPRGPVCAAPRAIAVAHWYVCRGRAW